MWKQFFFLFPPKIQYTIFSLKQPVTQEERVAEMWTTNRDKPISTHKRDTPPFRSPLISDSSESFQLDVHSFIQGAMQADRTREMKKIFQTRTWAPPRFSRTLAYVRGRNFLSPGDTLIDQTLLT